MPQHCPICGISCKHGWHCAWCGKALSSILHPDGFMRWHNSESGVRHYEECEQWRRLGGRRLPTPLPSNSGLR